MSHSRKQQMTARLIECFDPTLIDVRDDSHKHAGHAGVQGSAGETHFHIRLESIAFEDLPLLSRHRLVNECLQSFFDEGLHALSLDLKSPKSL